MKKTKRYVEAKSFWNTLLGVFIASMVMLWPAFIDNSKLSVVEMIVLFILFMIAGMGIMMDRWYVKIVRVGGFLQ